MNPRLKYCWIVSFFAVSQAMGDDPADSVETNKHAEDEEIAFFRYPLDPKKASNLPSSPKSEPPPALADSEKATPEPNNEIFFVESDSTDKEKTEASMPLADSEKVTQEPSGEVFFVESDATVTEKIEADPPFADTEKFVEKPTQELFFVESDAIDKEKQDHFSTPSKKSEHYPHVLVEAKASYFRPTDSKIHKIYSNTGLYGLEISCQTWRDLYVWGSVSYLTKTGHSIGGNHSTKASLVPLGLGLKWLHDFKTISPYVGLGMLETHFHCRDHSPFVIPRSSKWGLGWIGKAGLLIRPISSFFIDLFVDYSHMKFHFSKGNGKVIRHDVNFSGWSIGGGLGYRY